ncbi:MAG: tetratricopeptide repeat protein [Bdellovibrionaceae bacterium]|nr:tetratricopeptide repeat protein [Bdellovibrionales bacterium]MCB9253924.1 tetratricopeptide repeat protein [Pseudobdellovibrionaceae bacterium]
MNKKHVSLWVSFSLVLGLFALSGCATLLKSPVDKQKAKIHLQMAVDYLQRREYSQAIEQTHKALKMDPEYPSAYNHLALIYMETKRYDRAEKAFHKALSLKPKYPEVLNNLGVLMNRQEKYAEAENYFQKALADESYSTPENAHTNLGYALYKEGKLKQAKQEHQKALDIMPNFCLGNKNLGDVYAKERNYSRAEENYKRAVTNCPLFQEAQYKLGLVLMKMGRKKVARAELEKLVERHKRGPYVRRSNEVLKYLQ